MGKLYNLMVAPVQEMIGIQACMPTFWGAPWPQATPHLALRASREAKDTLARPSLRACLNILLSCKLWTDDRHHDDFPVTSSYADERRSYADDQVLSKKHKTQQISTDNTCEVPIARAGTVATRAADFQLFAVGR